jgi:HK97 family phage prohead protease
MSITHASEEAGTGMPETLAATAKPRSRSRVEFRALPAGYQLRDDTDTSMPTLVGTLAVFDEWTEINSRSEGHFLERISPGAFTKTVRENRDKMRVLFNHGQDPQLGNKPLGPITSLSVDERGVHYEVPLLDTSYNRDMVEMLRADPPVLGSSFRFQVIREDRMRKPKKSDYNPRGLDERTVQEVRMSEFGPVTFPAYSSTTTGLRSLTDEMLGEERVDAEDIGHIAQMLLCGTDFLQDQDEAGDAAAIAAMTGILTSLTGLLPAELAEDEPTEPGDDETNNAPPSEDAAERHLPSKGRRDTTSLYGQKEEKPSWRL